MSENSSENLSDPTFESELRAEAGRTRNEKKPLAENKPVIVALIIVGGLIAVLVAYLLLTAEPEPPVVSQSVAIKEAPVLVEPEPVAETEATITPSVAAEPSEPAPSAFVLPRLDDSDQLIRDGVLSLTREEAINSWLSPAELVRKFVVLVDNAANGNVAKDAVAVLTLKEPFPAIPVDDNVYIMDEAGYARYDSVTRIFTSLDSRRSVEFYDLLRPLFKQAYEELGYTDKSFEDVVFQAIGRILETPVLEAPVRLVRPVVMYRFEDPRLEALSPMQKQLVRMGPRNTRAIQAKVGEMARELRLVMSQQG